MRTLLLAAAALVALGGCADVSTDTAGLAPRTDTQPSEQDKAWMRAIHESNLAGVRAGQLGAGKGRTPRIKAIGKMLVVDHTKLDTKVTGAATRLHIELPMSPSADQRAMLAELQNSPPNDFDQDFTAAMINEHQDALAATKVEISHGTSPTVVALAKMAEPSLVAHLTALRQPGSGQETQTPTESSIGTPTGTTPGTTPGVTPGMTTPGSPTPHGE
ncbi:DUF4142 domain-containing protein [Nonomuraea sp. NPDC050153]|uniref:DUF4142 domain-containing protein n=1 Tax=Nonomuraea sp. NPDC050153 TaxID=3364359 RepID=UPI00379F52BB